MAEINKVDIDIRRPFDDPWKLVLRREGHPPYRVECLVHVDRMPDGAPHLRIAWKGRHRPAIRRVFERAISHHLEKSLLPEYTLTTAVCGSCQGVGCSSCAGTGKAS